LKCLSNIRQLAATAHMVREREPAVPAHVELGNEVYANVKAGWLFEPKMTFPDERFVETVVFWPYLKNREV